MLRPALTLAIALSAGCFGGSGSEAFLPSNPDPSDGPGPPPAPPTLPVVVKVELIAPTTMAIGDQAQLGLVALDADGKRLSTTAPVAYYSNNPAVATTTVEGLLSARAPGSARIWGTINGVAPGYRTVTVR